MNRTVDAIAVVACVLLSALGAKGQDTDAVITVVNGAGAQRLTDAGAVPLDPGAFSMDANMLQLGEGVKTASPDGTAVVVLPGLGVVVYVEPESELRVVAPPMRDSGVALVIQVFTGRATVVQESTASNWIAVEAGSKSGGPQAYTLSTGATLFVDAGADAASIATRGGQATMYAAPVPAAQLIDAAGAPSPVSGASLAAGQRMTVRPGAPPVIESDTGVAVPMNWAENVQQFALAQSQRWLGDAERGDFTPVRSAARGAPELLSAGFEPSLVFDQPRPVLTTTTSRPADTAIRTNLDPAQTLTQSGTPGTVVAGQRFRRSRIIANPGTSRTGALVVNPSSRPIFELAGGR